MTTRIRIAFALVAVALVAPQVARATPAPLPACTSALMMVMFPGYLDCRGAFSGNTNGSASELTALNAFGGAWANVWVWAGKSDDAGNGPFTSGPTSGPTNTIAFDTPISGTFVIGVKQCAEYSWYLFDETSAISSIAIDSRGTCANDGFSHIDLYTGDDTQGGLLEVTPEPVTMTLLATGLVGMVGVGRLRRRKSA